MIGAVVLDIGNVLMGWYPERFYDARIGVERRRRLFAEVPLDAMNLRVDHGAPFRASVEDLAEAHPYWRDEILMWHSGWLEMTADDQPRSVALMRAVRAKGVPVWALSNFGVETLGIAEAVYPWLAEFDERVISGELGVCKPDPAIYASVEAMGVAPARLLYADDRPANVDAAAVRGWRAHLYDGADGWAERLVAEGVLTEAEARAA